MTPAPVPIWFGPASRPLFGWLHRAEHPRGDSGLVLCNSFGYEAICAHRTLRSLAQAGAGEGIAVLRFDYDGTGDSAGSDLDPQRWAHWLGSLSHAIECLKEESGCRKVFLFGVRLGASLAATAASQRGDVAGLVGFAPVVRGRHFLRELRTLQAAGRSGTTVHADDVTESAGFLLTAETRAELSEVDLCRLGAPRGGPVLILERAELPADGAWLEHLRASGVDVERTAVQGYPEMMLNPHISRVPVEVLDRTLTWVRARGGARDASAAAPARPLRRPLAASSIITHGGQRPVEESAQFLEPNGQLFGILTQPCRDESGRHASGGAAAVLLVNAGGTHHIGPNRLHTELARHWAARGHTVLRLDLAGIGDSPPRPGEPDNVIYSRHSPEDISAALSFLRSQCRAPEIWAMGLCSGAYHVLKAALADLAIDGLVMINPLAFFWREGMPLDEPLPEPRVIAEASRYGRSARQFESWIKLLRGGVDLRRVGAVLVRRARSSTLHFARDLARRGGLKLQQDLGRDLQRLALRGVRLQFVFAAGDPGLELLREQGGSAVRDLQAAGRLQVAIIPGADHTFTSRLARRQLLRLLDRAVSPGEGDLLGQDIHAAL